jgi:hypothetical protein
MTHSYLWISCSRKTLTTATKYHYEQRKEVHILLRMLYAAETEALVVRVKAEMR